MFSIIEFNMPDRLKEAFTDCACNLLPADTPDYADILYTSDTDDIAQLQKQYYPKLIISTRPFELSTHTTNTITLADTTMYIGSVYPIRFTPVQSATDISAYQILADSVFRYLLKEKIQETADWCGHMSSVVHRM